MSLNFTLIKKLFLLFSILVFARLNAQSIDEIFDYNIGTLTGQGSWIEGGSFSGTGGTASRSIVSESLTYSNSGGIYELSGMGKSMLINIPTSVATSNYYHNKPLSTSYSNETVYMSFLMRVNTNISVSNQEAVGFSSGVNAASRVLIGATTAGFYKIGVIKGSTASSDYKYASSPTQLSVGTTYLVVLKYVFGATPIASVYINPIIGGAEPSSPEISDSTSATNRTPLNGLWSRAQGSAVAQNINISSLRVSTSWSDAVKPAVVKQSQIIAFSSLADRNTGDVDFSSGATASSGLTVSLSSSNSAVATIINGNIHIVGEGTTTITASQAGNINFLAATDVSRTLVVNSSIQSSQTITFSPIPTKGMCQSDFGPGATANSGLLVSYNSSNTGVATIVNGNIHIVGAGMTIITALQAGNNTYSAAANVTQTLTVTAATAPTSTAQNFCISNSPTVASLTAAGTTLQWYTTSSEVGALATTTALASGTYYVSQTVNTCESIRTSVSVSVIACSNLKIILKLDDFYSDSGSSTSTPTLDYLITKQIKAGIGFVANRNDATALSVYTSYLNQTNSNGDKLFEVWHHGFDHISPEFDGTSYAYQKSHFEDANQLILDGLRVQMHSFGAPFNATDGTTNTVVSENSNYKVTLFQNPTPNVSTGILNLTNRVNMESATGVPSYSTFITNYNLYKNIYTDYMVLQGHPFAWTTPEKMAEFSQIIDFLIAEGVQFVLPYDYYLTLNPSYPRPSIAQTISFSALSTKAKGDADFNPGATSTSGLTVTYNSSNSAVATIVNGSIHIVGSGSTVITASQIGNVTYKPANYISQTFTVTSREFRSLSSGNWNTPGTWQQSDGNGNWNTSTTLPTALNNVYIQSGHTITVNSVEAHCYDLHTNTAGVLAISGTNNVNVNGKIRAYTGLAEISTANGVYIGTNATSLLSAMITTSSTGVLKIVGATRNVTNTGEWVGATTSNNVTFALDSGAIGTLQTAIKFKVITIASGTVSTANTINVGSNEANGFITINNGARLVSSRNYTAAGAQAITLSSVARCGTVTIDSGGILELTGAAPVIDCAVFTNNGTVVYSGGVQTLLQNGSFSSTKGVPITSYANLTIGGTGAKTLPTNTNISVSGALNFQETGVKIITGTNTLTIGTAGSITGAGTGWVIGNLIKQTNSNTNPSFVYAIGDAINYTPIALTFTGNTAAAGSIAASTTAGDHPQVVTSGINGSKSVNRTWSLTNSGITGFTNYSAAFTYASTDNDASATPANYGVNKYENSTWSFLTISGTSTATAATATDITDFGDFVIGEITFVAPTATITAGGTTTFCSGGSVILSATTGTGLIYLWSPGGATTSSITAIASGNYTVKVTNAGGETTSAPTTVTVNENVIPAFATVAAICTTETLSALPITSTNGITGTWSPALNNLATTEYTFTPTIEQCANTATLTITVIPNVTPAFAQVSPICSGATLAPLPINSSNSVTGTWSPALNNLATSTYTFTPDAGECATTTTLTITVKPLLVYYADTDADGFGNATVTLQSCNGAPIGYVTNSTDCDDTNSAVSPGTVITGQPSNPTICKLVNATVTVAVIASTSSSATYQWFSQAATATTWTSIVNNTNYSGATSATLTITRTTTSLPSTGTKYKVVVSGGQCGDATSGTVTLQESLQLRIIE